MQAAAPWSAPVTQQAAWPPLCTHVTHPARPPARHTYTHVTQAAPPAEDVPEAVVEAGDLAEGEPTSYAFHCLPQRTRVEIVRV